MTINNLLSHTLVLFVLCLGNLAAFATQLSGTAVTAATSVLGASDGTITVSATGGSTPYQYKVAGGSYSTSATITGLASGDYTVWVKDNNNDEVKITGSANLVANGGGETGAQGSWTLVNGGDGWTTNGAAHTGSYGFTGSYGWCTMTQTIDLVAAGYTTAELDAAPEVNYSAWHKAFFNATDYYYCVVTLQNSSYGTITSSTDGSTGSTSSTSSWQESTLAFTGYGTGLRYVKIEIRSKDSEFWAGYYGASIDDVYLSLNGLTHNVKDGPSHAWTGTTSTDWNTTTNWSTSTVPTSSSDITIPDVSGASGNFPVLGSGATGVCDDITIAANASLTINSGYELEVSGNWSNSGTASVGTSGTVEFKGTSAQAISGTTTFGNVIINSSNTVSLSAALNVDGNLTLSAGTLSPGAYNMTLAGNWTSTGNYFTEGSGTVTLDGTATQTVSGSSASLSSAGSLLTQGFNSASIPSGWSEVDVSGSAGDITFPTSSSHPSGISPSEGSNFVVFNSWTASSTSATRLESPSFSTTGLTAINVTFDWGVDAGYSSSDDRVMVQYSLNGSSWTDISSVSRYDAGGTSWDSESIALPAGAQNQATVYIGFKFISAYGNDCALDNVDVTYTGSETYTGEAFTNFTINKSAGGVTLNSKVIVTTGMTFTSADVTATSVNFLEFDEDATVSGASDASHVVGPIKKRTNTTTKFTFPCGDGTNYRLASITPSTSDATTWTGEYKNAGYGDYTENSGTIDHVCATEYWNIDRSGSANATVELSWGSTSGGVSDYTELGVAHWKSGTSEWEVAGDVSPTGNNSTGVVSSAAAWSSYSPFTLFTKIVANTLPVTLVDFAGSCNNNEHHLKWTTLTEQQNAYFDIEGSLDNKHFETIGRVAGAGDSFEERSYDWSTPANYNYYRLKQVDYDTKHAYSSAIHLTCVQEESTFSVYPNPFRSNVQIKFSPSSTSTTFTLFDSLGRTVTIQTVAAGASQFSLPVDESLPAGQYFLKAENNGVVSYSKLMK